jgi:hypothetical protein
MTTEISELGAAIFISRHSVFAISQFVVKWVKKSLDERVRVGAFKIVFTRVPVAILADRRAFFGLVKEHVGRSSEILLSVRIVALTPFVFLVN